MKKFVAVTLAILLAGCGSIGLQSPFVSKEPSTRVPARVAKVPAVTMVPADVPSATEPSTQTQVGLASFPSSKNPTKGKTWTEMGLFPYKGTLDQAVSQMPLSGQQKTQLRGMFASGECSRYEIKDGEKFAVDWLNFTAGGVHKNRTKIAADLKKLPSRMATICNLGDGVYAGQFDGCKNFFVSFSTAPAVVKVEKILPGASAPGVCPSGRTLTLHLWDRNKLPGDLQEKLDHLTTLEETRNGSFKGHSVSRDLGGELRRRADQKKEFDRSGMMAKVLPSFLDENDSKIQDLPTVGITGSGRFAWKFSNEEIEGKTLSLIFPDARMISPPSVGGKPREMRFYWEEWGQSCSMNVHAAHW